MGQRRCMSAMLAMSKTWNMSPLASSCLFRDPMGKFSTALCNLERKEWLRESATSIMTSHIGMTSSVPSRELTYLTYPNWGKGTSYHHIQKCLAGGGYVSSLEICQHFTRLNTWTLTTGNSPESFVAPTVWRVDLKLHPLDISRAKYIKKPAGKATQNGCQNHIIIHHFIKCLCTA